MIHKEAWYEELRKISREMSLPYDPMKEPGAPIEEDGIPDEDPSEV